MTIVIRRHPHILLKQRVHAQPTCILRVEVASTIVVEPCLLVEFLGVEEVRGVPHTVALLDEDLAVRDVGDVLGHLSVSVRHECSAAQVVWVVEEYIDLGLRGVAHRGGSAAIPVWDQLVPIPVATEGAIVFPILVLLQVVGHVELLVPIVYLTVQRTVLAAVVDLTDAGTRHLHTARVGAETLEVTYLAGDSFRAGVNVLGVFAPVLQYEVWRHVGHELGVDLLLISLTRSVDVELLHARRHLDGAFTVGVVEVVGYVSVVVDG